MTPMPDSRLPTLLELLGVKRVIVVDDQFVPSAATYTLAFAEGEGPEVEGIPPLPDGAVYEDHVQQHWPEVPLPVKLELRKQALKVEGFDDPTGDPTGLRQHVATCYFKGMTLHEWQHEHDKLLSDQRRALILFDINFERETGDPSDESGLTPAGQALRASHDHIVGILTTKAAMGDEQRAANDWAPRAKVARANLVVVNKNLLEDPDNHDDLARAVEQIGSALQASQLSHLRHTVEAALESGIREAAEDIAGRSPAVLQDLVFRASHEGGEWEADTWFRLYGTLGLKRAREEVASDPRARRAIADVRGLLQSQSHSAHDESEAFAAKVQRAEAYDHADYLNRTGLPIANGDIFTTKEGRAFILVGQPCDLMLRPEGRAMDPHSATLLPIKRPQTTPGTNETSSYQLPDGGPLGEDKSEVRFRPEYHVAFDVLDLVSFNTEGRAVLEPRRGTKLTPLLPGLQDRFEAIVAAAEKCSKLLELIERMAEAKSITAQAANQLRHQVLHAGGPFKATLSRRPTPFAFDCQRVGRLTGTYADALLTAHASARSRTAHAHELTRIVADDGSALQAANS